MTISEFFKEKINWKFYNFLRDKLTPLEDNEVMCYIKVSLPRSIENGEAKFSYYTIFQYSYKSGDTGTYYAETTPRDVNAFIAKYEEVGVILYCVYIAGVENREKYLNTIKKRYSDVKMYNYDQNVMLCFSY